MERYTRSAMKLNSGAVGNISPATTSPDLVLQWGNRKRLRYLKVHLQDQESNKDTSEGKDPLVSKPVQTARIDRRVMRLESTTNKVPNQPASKNNVNINLRQRPACPAPRKLRNSDRRRRSIGGMRGNGTNGIRGSGSPAINSNNHQQLQSNNNKNNNSNKGWMSVTTSSENKKGGECRWPAARIEIGLTHKEKEEDFLAIKGSKLPHRPKKRPKLIQRNLNLVSPGSWLCDLSVERYEVREKKVSKKKARGLKDMESMDSDSE